MSNERTCEHCDHYSPCGYYGLCLRPESDKVCVERRSAGCKFFKPRTNKVKPRRLCYFCERHRPIDDDYGRYTMEFAKLIPLESINLTTGERTKPERKVEYALFLYEDKDDGEVGSFPIKYCPLCGRKLDGDGEKP